MARKPGDPLNDRFLQSLLRNGSKTGSFGDGRGHHGLRVVAKNRKDGSRSMLWRQRIRIKNGPEVNLGLGSYPALSLKDARDKAEVYARLAKEGIDPRKPEEPVKKVPLFSDVAERVFERDCKGWSKSTREGARRRLDNYILPKLGNKRVDTILRADVYDVMVYALSRTPSAAGEILGYIQKIFVRAIMEGPIEVSPVDEALRLSLPKNPHKVKHRASVPYHLVGQAMSKMRGSTYRAYPSTKLCMLFVILTACRHGEARQMRWSELRWKRIESPADWNGDHWDEVDWDELKPDGAETVVWMVPDEHIKTRKFHRVPISTECLNLLIEAREMRKARKSEFVFPSRNKPYGPITEHGLIRLCHMLKLQGTPHGFRASFRNWCGEHGVPFDVAEIALSHELSDVVRAYLRTDLLQLRADLMQAWSDYVHGKLEDDWKWSTGNEELVKQIEALTKLLEDLREDMRKLMVVLEAAQASTEAAEKRAKVAEARAAEMEVELRDLRDLRDSGQLALAL